LYKVFESEESEEYINCHTTNLYLVRAVKSKLRRAEHTEKNQKFSDRTFRKYATQNTENGEENTVKSSRFLKHSQRRT